MDSFKFLCGGNPFILDELPVASACWMFIDPIDVDDSHIVLENRFDGILQFLSRFDDHRVIGVLSITGPNNVEHNYVTQGTGWGFNIQRDSIHIKWVEPIPL
jgi:hypothetical protein